MSTMASQITSLAIVYSSVYSGSDQRKHQISASLALVRGIHRSPVNSPHKGQWRGKYFHSVTSTWWFCRDFSLSCFSVVLQLHTAICRLAISNWPPLEHVIICDEPISWSSMDEYRYRLCIRHWKPELAMMLTLSSGVTQVVVMRNYGPANDSKFGITITSDFNLNDIEAFLLCTHPYISPW